MALSRSAFGWLLHLLVMFVLVSCGGGGGDSAGGGNTSAPVITTHPSAQSVTVGQTATFTVSATGMPTLAYQWMKNGNNITGANASSYTTSPTVIGDNGAQYSVLVSNSAGSVTSSAANLTVTQTNLGYLMISEVSTCHYYDVGCWFEVYNPTPNAVDLSNYTLKSTAVDTTNGTTAASQTFTLPAFTVPAGGYVVVSGKGTANYVTQRSTQQLWLRSGNMVPWWSNSGFIELISGSSTVDFVKFGTSTQNPSTSSAWTGSAVAALLNSSYGQSIVRTYPGIATTDTNTSSDWTAVSWTTPAGRNDVPSGATDADNDGIPDTAEVSGGTYAGLDLYAMGARTGQKDLFIEVDYMDSSDPGVIPRQESLQKVVSSFAAQGFSVHFDAGNQFSTSFSTASFNLGQGDNVVPYEKCVTLNNTTCTGNLSTRRSIYDWKEDNFDLRRRAIFHYALFGNSQLNTGASGSSGVAELPGNDFLMTMGAWGFSTSDTASLNLLINMQASTLMHELGHNLNLQHGGSDSVNYKPNYWSIMNYTYQLMGLDANPTAATAYLRWRGAQGDGKYNLAGTSTDFCALPNSPCGSPSQFVMSYSTGAGSNLNEAALSESNNVGRGVAAGAYADWDLSGALTSGTFSRDLNGDGSSSSYSDYNDWANIYLTFSRNYSGNSGQRSANPSTTAVTSTSNPVTNDRQPFIVEDTPSDKVLKLIRSAR